MTQLYCCFFLLKLFHSQTELSAAFLIGQQHHFKHANDKVQTLREAFPSLFAIFERMDRIGHYYFFMTDIRSGNFGRIGTDTNTEYRIGPSLLTITLFCQQ